MAPSHPTRGPRRTGPALLLLLGACAAAGPPGMTGDAYASLQQALRADPGARAAFTRRCTEGRAAEPQAARELVARMLGVGPDQVDRVFCERETAAIARGAIGYEDFSALTAHRADAAAAARVLDALTAPASPSTVAAADRLEAYAHLLGETGRGDRAAGVAAQAGRLRDAERADRAAEAAFAEGRPYETNTYLGFAPDRVLLEYAAELRRLGRAAEAGEVEAVAVRYREDQARSVEELVRQHRGGQHQ